MRVLVSSCILGENCKYNGKNNRNELALDFLKDKEVVSICPEMLAGMSTPRACAELVDGVVMDHAGNNLDADYRKAVELALSEIMEEDFDLVILQSRSPTCGVNTIYDGTFSGKITPGSGIFAKALIEKGYHVIDVENLHDL